MGGEGPVHQIGQWALLWRRFQRHRLALIGARVLLAMILLALLGAPIAPPILLQSPSGDVNLPLWLYQQRNLPPQLWPFHLRFLLGTDANGNAILSYVLVGARATLAIGIFGSLLASLLGAVIGGVAGYLGGVVDAFLMRVVDAFLAIPFVLLLVLLSQSLTDRGVVTYVLLFGLVGWPGVARLVRSYGLSLREREFTTAARALGVSDPGIILRHLLPNTLDILIVSTTLNVALFVVTEATLEFLQSGPDAVTWGAALSAAFNGILQGYWWQIVFPGAALLLIVLSVNFLGDGLRDALDTTGSGALIAHLGEPVGGRESRILQTVGLTWSATRALAALPARALAAVPRPALPTALRRPVPPIARPARTVAGTASPALRFGPVAVAFLVAGLAMLYGHSPLEYAPSYPPPTTYAPIYGQSEYAALPLPGRGWDIFAVDRRAHVSYRRVDGQGRSRLTQTFGPGDAGSAPSLARSGGWLLGAWVAGGGSTLQAAFLGRHRSSPFSLAPQGGDLAEHPDVLAGYGHRFYLLFGWQRGSVHDLYLASIQAGTTRPSFVRRLTRSHDYALYPRGAVDGSGALDLLYLQRRSPTLWDLLFQRFTPSGAPLSRPEPLDTVEYAPPSRNGTVSPDTVPPQWPMDVERQTDGSVWVAWEGNAATVVSHWSFDGKVLLEPSIVLHATSSPSDTPPPALALALTPTGGELYYTRPGAVSSVLAVAPFTYDGAPVPPQPYRTAYDADGNRFYPADLGRVAFDGGGNAAEPRAGTVNGDPVVLWEKVRTDGTVLEGTHYRPAQPPDLLTQLGLNIGNPWANLALILFGAIAGGIGLTVVNVFVLAPLILAWLPIARLPARLRWLAYLLVIALALSWLFALRPAPPGFVLVIAPLGTPYNWIVVAEAIFVSYWTGRHIVARQDALFRAAGMALSGIFFIAVMYAAVLIEGELGRI